MKFIKFTFGAFALVGIFFAAIGCWQLLDSHKFKQTALTAPATITRIDEHRDSDGDTSHTVYVTFNVNGADYSGRLGYYTSSMYTGKEVDVLYNPDNPAQFHSANGSFIGIFFIIFGVVFALIGIIPFIFMRRGKSRKQYLLANGRPIGAKICEVYQNTSLKVNGRSPFVIICQGVDGHTGELREFKSENLWNNPTLMLERMGTKSLQVYLHDKKPHQYYVDVRGLIIK